jgi:outer membrane receptor protein involved in Fe transport
MRRRSRPARSTTSRASTSSRAPRAAGRSGTRREARSACARGARPGNFGAQLRASLGRYDPKGDKGEKHALIQDYEGALEMPIVEEALSSRFAFRLREADPYKTNSCGYALPFAQRLRLKSPTVPGFGADTPGVSQCGERGTAQGGMLAPGGVSNIPFGLPSAVNDEHNWAARGTLRFQPPDTELEFFLSAHGSRLDQDSTLGQAIGTFPALPGGNTTPQIRFASTSQAAGGYIDRDVAQEFNQLCADANPGPFVTCANTFVQPQLAKRIAQTRPLDQRPYRGDYNRIGQTTRDAWGFFVSGEGEVFANTKLFGLSSYDGYERFQDVDSDFTPEVLFETVQGDRAWQTYNELQLSGELASEPVDWDVGGYYLREDLDNDGTVFTSLDPTAPGNVRRVYSQTIDSFALWGDFGWDFADDFTLEGGVRYNWERKQFDFTKIGGSVTGATVRSREAETWATPTGQIILTYHIDAEKSAYARYTRGFKAGHFNALASETGAEAFNGTFNVDPAKEEYNDAWEAGLRGGWLDGRFSLAGAFFYYRYENYQIFLFTDSADPTEPPVLAIVNAPQAENFGIELEGGLRPLEGWAPRLLSGLRLSGNFSWLHGEYIDFTTFQKFIFAGNPNAANVAIDYSGNQLQNSPQYKVSATAEWTFDLGRFGYLIPRYDMNWSDDVFFDPNEGHGSINPTGGPALVNYGVGQRAYFLHNVRLAYRTPTGNLEVAGWIRNVEDQVYKTYAFDVSRFTQTVINFTGEPRTIGFDLSFTF